MRSVLVLRGGALGDFVVTLPALAGLRLLWPESQIELVGNAVAAQLARSRGLLDAVHSQHESRWAALYGRETLPRQLAEFLSRFDLVLNFWPDPDGELAARFPVRSDQCFVCAPAMPTVAPAARHYLAPLAQFGLQPDELWTRISPVTPDTELARHPIIVHPGSGSPRKNWPAERWRQLIAELPPPVTMIIGEAEVDTWANATLLGVRKLVNAPLETLIAELAGARLFMGHDSGVSHLAAATGVPCLLLFGPTDPVMWAPPAPAVRVLQCDSTLESIRVAEVREALAKL